MVQHAAVGSVLRRRKRVKWLNQVTNFNVEVGAMQNPIMADKYFDPSLYLEVAGSSPN
jgi:hypothetical protein